MENEKSREYWRDKKQPQEKKPETNFVDVVIPENQRQEYITPECKHQNAKVMAERPDGLADCYCETCHMGGLYNSIEEFKRS